MFVEIIIGQLINVGSKFLLVFLLIHFQAALVGARAHIILLDHYLALCIVSLYDFSCSLSSTSLLVLGMIMDQTRICSRQPDSFPIATLTIDAQF